MKLIHLAAVLVALFFCAPAARAADAPAAEQQQQQQQSSQQQQQEKPVARREEVEPKTLPEAIAELKKARTERDDAETKLLNEESAHGKTKALLKDTIETAKTAGKDRDTAQAEVGKLTKECADEKASHGKTKELLTLAEGALQVKGVKVEEIVPASAEETGKGLVEEFMAASPSARAAMIREKGDALYKAASAAGVKIG